MTAAHEQAQARGLMWRVRVLAKSWIAFTFAAYLGAALSAPLATVLLEVRALLALGAPPGWPVWVPRWRSTTLGRALAAISQAHGSAARQLADQAQQVFWLPPLLTTFLFLSVWALTHWVRRRKRLAQAAQRDQQRGAELGGVGDLADRLDREE